MPCAAGGVVWIGRLAPLNGRAEHGKDAGDVPPGKRSIEALNERNVLAGIGHFRLRRVFGVAVAMPMVWLALERSEGCALWRRVCDLIVVALVRHERVLCNLQLNGCVQAPECDARPLI